MEWGKKFKLNYNVNDVGQVEYDINRIGETETAILPL
jgi:hypothetical protein